MSRLKPNHNATRGGWRDMSTAPKDQSLILVWTHREHYELARWNLDQNAKHPKPYWNTTGPWVKLEMRQTPPLAWMPLPEPPNAELSGQTPKT